MKKLLFITTCLAAVYGVTAQRIQSAGGDHTVTPDTGKKDVSLRLGFYSPVSGPVGEYSVPYGSTTVPPTELERKEETVRSAYADRIYSVRHDSTLSSSQKHLVVRSLKKRRQEDLHNLTLAQHRNS